MAVVVVEKLSPSRAPGGYAEDCAALTRDYGTAAWESRPEVAEIRRAVFAALDRLEAETGLGGKLKGRPVLVKPNLVTVYHRMGLARRTYPESTDPRVLDAALLWLGERASSLTIVESSGRGAPTRGSFRVAGVDRLARRRGAKLVALEETPVDRYLLPKARVQREILVPRPFSAVVRGEAAYVSLPKLKTNLYTGVTLGFKNAMGVIPYNLRQRNHHYAIDRKLVEMLYLFKPDLVLVDGVVGGEGECPAPVDPVDSRMVIAGDHPVETDRVATRLMGHDPSRIELMRVADELGFGDPEGARVLARGFGLPAGAAPGDAGPGGAAPNACAPDGDGLGGAVPVAFRPADWSLHSERVRKGFPSVLVLIGIDKGLAAAGGGQCGGACGAGGASDAEGGALGEGGLPGGGAAAPAFVRGLEASCRGGCVATTRFAFSMLEHEGIRPRRRAVLVLGAGVPTAQGRRWYDAEGKAYDEAAIAALPGRKAVIGSCGRAAARLAERFVDGCMPLPNAPHMVLHELVGRPCRVMSLRNENLFPMLAATLGARRARQRLIEEGCRLDVPLGLEDGLVPGRALAAGEEGRDWLPWPLPPLGAEEARRLLAFEDDAALAAFRGVLVFRVKERLLWRAKALLTGTATLAPLALAAAGAAGAGLWLAPAAWLGMFLAVEALHACELPASLRARRLRAMRRGRTWGRADAAAAVAATLAVGYPAWLPHRHGVFD
ncbi:MAG TPA: DUF362 domain-containing protein [Spirochaetia bacterium]|nr:DUF362 domain-containing protein [Spirochaetales bacterium]HRY72677.1 DUF362 domain-containing protein [Spirochaetia bacterium]